MSAQREREGVELALCGEEICHSELPQWLQGSHGGGELQFSHRWLSHRATATFDIDPEFRGMCAFPANLGINDGKCQGGVSPSDTRNILARVGVGRPSGN